ncbi:MAG: trans-aconitate 2-methyltransferase [Acidisphaera sp.]|nr:trans-aconitate 2-methyltransferase [Acidisphaera sp.]
MSAGWDPAQYLRFAGERLRPALDLLVQVPLPDPAQVVDLGCGAGNVTAMLRRRWPQAEVVGIDGSAAMLAEARAVLPGCRFERADIAAWRPACPPELIFSNAALQWLPDHARLLPRLLGLLAGGGVLAVQMPAMHAAPLRRLQAEVAAGGPWAERLAGVAPARAILEAGEYWDLLRPACASLDIWETTYLHALEGEDAVLQWALGTSLRPYADRLDGEERARFLRAYAAALRPHYPRRPDGTTLLPFRRLFLLARRE